MRKGKETKYVPSTRYDINSEKFARVLETLGVEDTRIFLEESATNCALVAIDETTEIEFFEHGDPSHRVREIAEQYVMSPTEVQAILWDGTSRGVIPDHSDMQDGVVLDDYGTELENGCMSLLCKHCIYGSWANDYRPGSLEPGEFSIMPDGEGRLPTDRFNLEWWDDGAHPATDD